jgi:hypothetical protein
VDAADVLEFLGGGGENGGHESCGTAGLNLVGYEPWPSCRVECCESQTTMFAS